MDSVPDIRDNAGMRLPTKTGISSCGAQSPRGRFCVLPPGHDTNILAHRDAGVMWMHAPQLKPDPSIESQRAHTLLQMEHDRSLQVYDPNDPDTWKAEDVEKCQSIFIETGRQCMLPVGHRGANHIAQDMDEYLRGDPPVEWGSHQRPAAKTRTKA